MELRNNTVQKQIPCFSIVKVFREFMENIKKIFSKH